MAALDAILVRGGCIFSPEALGVGDVLVVQGRIVAAGAPLERSPVADEHVREIDATGSLVVPAIVDQHCHPTGGGGGGGWRTQNPPIPLDDFLRAGVGSLVGCLGHDTSVRSPEALLARVRSLHDQGLQAGMFTGEIGFPPVTITGSLMRDLALVPEVLGIKAAVGERGSGIRSAQQLTELASQAARGSRTAGKSCIVHLHIGTGAKRLAAVKEALDEGAVDPGAVTLTHVNWDEPLLREVAALAPLGVNLDVTACIRPEYFPGTVDPAEAIGVLLKHGVPVERLTVSSDSGGCHTGPDGELVTHDPALLPVVLRDLVQAEVAATADIVAMFTRNPADRLGLRRKGRVAPGADADLLLLDKDFAVSTLLLAGREYVTDGRPVVHDAFHV